MLRRLIPCLVLLFAPLMLAAQEKAADVLILSSHTTTSEWQQLMMKPIESLEKERPDLTISELEFGFVGYADTLALLHDLDDALSLQQRPRLVVLLGGSAFALAPQIDHHWENIPLLLLGEQDYYCDLSYGLGGRSDPGANRYPVIDLWKQGLNLTLISAPSLISGTIEMILHVQPQLETLYFLGGENYLSKERQWQVEDYMQKHHPEIDYQALLSMDVKTDWMIDLLEKSDDRRTAVLFGSWLVHDNYYTNRTTRHNALSLVEHLIPTYTLFGNDFEKHPYLVGYNHCSAVGYSNSVRQRILDVLDDNVQPGKMPFLVMQAGMPALNYSAMEHFGLDTSLIPKDAEVYNAPHSLWERHKKQIMWWALFVLLGLGGSIIYILHHSMRTMRKARSMAENASQMKTAFIQNMSHEVRTPLNAIAGFSQLLCTPDGYLTGEEKAEYLQNVKNNSRLLTMMMNDMQGIAEMQSGNYSIHKAPTNLNEMVRQAIMAVEFRVPPGVALVRRFGLKENARYVTDGMRVQQILINFLTNACKHTEKGEITIGSSLEENPGQITFYVADTGPGVPKGMEESIFDRFVKLDEFKQGTGLGLTICRMVAESLHGKVWLDTTYKGGARFVFTIPKKEA